MRKFDVREFTYFGSCGKVNSTTITKKYTELISMLKNPVETFYGVFKKGSSLVKVLLEERKQELEREEKELFAEKE